VGRYIDDQDGHFRIEYRAPFGGIDSSAPPQFIDGSSLVDCNNILIRDGQLTPAQPQLMTSVGLPTDEALIGFGELPFLSGTGSTTQYDPAGIFAITVSGTAGAIVVKAYQAGDITGGWINIGSQTDSAIGPIGRLTFITINQIVYFSAPGLTQIYSLSLVPGSVTFEFQLLILTSVLGCDYIAEMNGRLIAMNVWQLVSGPAITNFPYQIAWSADSEQYGIWNVLDMSGNPTGAGFNNLPDVEDVITGAQFIGSTAYIYRQQGITEMTGLNSGIDPFDFNHMWASQKGIGCPFDGTMSQYGSEGAFVSDTDIFTMGLGGIGQIGGVAKQAIYKDIYTSKRPGFGLVTPLVVNGEPEICYIIALQQPTGSNYLNIFWVYSYVSKQWTRLSFTTANTLGLIDCRTIYKYLLDGTTPETNATYNQPVWAFQAAGAVPQFYTLPDPPSTTGTVATLVFPVELIAPFRDITIDAIATWTPATAGSIIHSIKGTAYQTVSPPTDNDENTGYYQSFLNTKSAALTYRCPQLSTQITGQAPIGHIVLYGSQTPSRPF
jgi:hypothetical protein